MADTCINITGSIGHPKSNCLYRTEKIESFRLTSLHSVKKLAQILVFGRCIELFVQFQAGVTVAVRPFFLDGDGQATGGICGSSCRFPGCAVPYFQDIRSCMYIPVGSAGFLSAGCSR